MTKPLLICDADEVLLQFASAFGSFLERQGWVLTFRTFALTGNIRHAQTSEIASKEVVDGLLDQFFEEDVESFQAVPGAPEALARLATFADVIILTNVPFAQRGRRARNLDALGMPYPVIANSGLKGPKVAELIADRTHPVAFVDDIPYHHTSVAQSASRVHRLHLVADPQLRGLIAKAPDADARIDDWHLALPHLEAILRGG
jgi:hypothetical protein